MTWYSKAIGDGPIGGPLGQRYIQCHARWRTYDRTIRCQNIKRRDRIGQCPPDEWLCYVHEETEIAFSDYNDVRRV